MALMVTHVLVEQEGGLRVRRVRLRDRLEVRLRAPALDRELAGGASPEASVALAVHAGQLCGRPERSLLAHSLVRLATAAAPADGRTAAPRLMAPLSRTAIRRSDAELSAVVQRLEGVRPVGAQGVARVRSLLTDGTGPLYRRAAPGRLAHDLQAALEAMDRVA
jgi:hypothetical protein